MMVRNLLTCAVVAVIQLVSVAPSTAFLVSPFPTTPHAYVGRATKHARRSFSVSPSQPPRSLPRKKENVAIYPTSYHSLPEQPPGDRPTSSGASAGLSTLPFQRSKRDQLPRLSGRFAAICASALALGFAVTVLGSSSACAAAKAAATVVAEGAEKPLHIGQKIAQFFRRGGLPDWATLMAISALPVVELRGGVPVGIWMGLPITQVFALCVVGNMIPIPAILFVLKSPFVRKVAKPVLSRAREKAEEFGDAQSQALALTLFVGIPLPGTGAWTGAMGASLLEMPFHKAMLSIFLGVVSAGVIMSCLTLSGRKGALLATAVLAVFCLSNINK
ncbi:unnamed protein product [Ascophyllum nodosum]